MMSKTQNAGRSLTALLQGFVSRDAVPDIDILNIASNSRAVLENTLFIALAGINSHAIDFAIDAVKSGAVVILYDAGDEYCRRRVPLLSKQVQAHWIGIEGLDRANGEIVSRFYGEPGKSLKIIGVTGTDGKTSVTHLLTQALGRLGKSTASIGTLGYGVGNELQPTTHTTPDTVSLQTYLHEFQCRGCEYVVMEVSSHALEQYRVSGCHFDIAVLTNLGRDHLDYHQDMAQYAAAKARLFRDFDLSARVLNADDELGLSLSEELETEGMIRYSRLATGKEASAEVYLLHSEVTDRGLDMQVATPLGEIRASTALMGQFNIDNTLACISTLIALGLEHAQIQLAVNGLQPIPGRMEKFSGNANTATAVIDFAHTEQALRACLTTSREHTRGKLWCIFGCGGDRDQGKRKGMGRAAEELADRIIITDDNPRTEPAENIVAEIIEGLGEPDRACVVHNRQAAIEYALTQAAADDLVVIAGKGHELEQIVGNQRFPFSDRHVVQRFLATS
ncbi:MAG: UDP-N-acetylmuramoyl-L-alanyl-D-glutamate--2,6-diaminopimelate ligase [Gammaproteobacteria bacterium]|nr:MAG: UDP-N-acetylmuramoyl-L-alanyl-D-glutamate--2,6-diaminopimelate ligase [Gammaproteobacteria bacterium]